MAFHLWRRYATAPYRRFACTVEKADTEDGFRITDYDENVADVHFLHSVTHTLRSHHTVRTGEEDGTKIVENIEYVGPEHPEHFESAIRMVPGAVLRGVGRPA